MFGCVINIKLQLKKNINNNKPKQSIRKKRDRKKRNLLFSPLYRNSTNSSSNIPDVALSKLIPKINYSQMPSTSAPTNQSEQFATDVSTSPFTIPYKNHGATSSQQQPSSVPLSSLLLLDSPKPNNNRCIAALSTPITQFNSLYGRNGIKSSLARGQLQRSSDNDSNSDNRSDAASSSRRNNSPSSIISYLQKSSSGSGDAKGYKLLNHSNNSQSDHTFIH